MMMLSVIALLCFLVVSTIGSIIQVFFNVANSL